MDNLPRTPKAAKEAGEVHYFTGKPCKRGHISKRFASTAQCVMCQAFHMKVAYDTNPEKFRARSRADFHSNKEARLDRAREWRENNPDYHAVYYAFSDQEVLKERRKKWNQENRALKRFYWAKYIYAKRNATPHWLTDEQEEDIKGFYREAVRLTVSTGIQHEVDHIIPLQGKGVCGLHVPWNLQVLTWEQNVIKGNKYDH